MGYLHRSPAELEDDNEEWVIQHLLICTHSSEENMMLRYEDVSFNYSVTHSCTVGMNMKGNVANTQRDPNR